MINQDTTEVELIDAQLETVTGALGGYGTGFSANNYQFANQQAANYSANGNNSLNLWSNASSQQQNNQNSAQFAYWNY